MDDVVIRPVAAGDAEAIRRIYNHEVEHTTHTFDLVPRTLEDQRAWLRDREGALAVVADARLGPASPKGPTSVRLHGRCGY